MLRLTGRASNRDGLGTVVRLTLDDGRVLMNHATTSVGFASSSDPRVHFGVPPKPRHRTRLAAVAERGVPDDRTPRSESDPDGRRAE